MLRVKASTESTCGFLQPIFNSSHGIPLPSLSAGAWEPGDIWTLFAQQGEAIQDWVPLWWLPMCDGFPEMRRCRNQVYFVKAPLFFVPTNGFTFFLWYLQSHVSFLQLAPARSSFCLLPHWLRRGKAFPGWEQFSAHFATCLLSYLLDMAPSPSSVLSQHHNVLIWDI